MQDQKLVENLELTLSRYLLIDLEAATNTVQRLCDGDLIIRKNKNREVYTVIKNGIQILGLLHTLIDNHGSKIISHSEENEKD